MLNKPKRWRPPAVSDPRAIPRSNWQQWHEQTAKIDPTRPVVTTRIHFRNATIESTAGRQDLPSACRGWVLNIAVGHCGLISVTVGCPVTRTQKKIGFACAPNSKILEFAPNNPNQQTIFTPVDRSATAQFNSVANNSWETVVLFPSTWLIRLY